MSFVLVAAWPRRRTTSAGGVVSACGLLRRRIRLLLHLPQTPGRTVDMSALPEFIDQDLAAAPTTLREVGRHHCRCVYVHPATGAGLWSANNGAGTVWIAREEGVPVSVGTEAYITVGGLRPILWLFPKRNDFHRA